MIGAPFLVMDKVDGFTPGIGSLQPFRSDPGRRRDLAVAIRGRAGRARPRSTGRGRGLDGLGKPDGFLERQVPRWLAQLDRYRTRDLPGARLRGGLAGAQPAGDGPGRHHARRLQPVQRDGRPGPPARLAAMIDWDTGTIGDPLLDIGHLLARWTEPGRGAGPRRQARRTATATRPARNWPRVTPSGRAATCPRSPTTRRWRCSSWR